MALSKVKNIHKNAKAQIEAHQESIRAHWWFRPIQVIFYLIGFGMFLFFNADDIWKGIQEYERSAKEQTTRQAVWTAVKADIVDKAQCSFYLVKYGIGIKDHAVEAGEELIEDTAGEIERRIK